MAFTSKIGGGRGSSGGGRKSSKNKIPTAYKIGGPKDKSLRAKEKFQKSMKNSNLTKQDMKKAIGTGAALGAGSAIGMAGYLKATKKGIFTSKENVDSPTGAKTVFQNKKNKK
jgi:hypothetical protein